MSEKKEVQEKAKAALERVQGAAGEVRLKLHLASMDAKTSWDELEPRVRDFEERVKSGTHAAGEELVNMGHELEAELKKVRETLKS